MAGSAGVPVFSLEGQRSGSGLCLGSHACKRTVAYYVGTGPRYCFQLGCVLLL